MKITLIPKVIVEISIGCNVKEEETNNQQSTTFLKDSEVVVLSI